jgi:hypothetical protein
MNLLERKAEEFEKLREAFITRAARPTYEELAEEFSIPRSTIGERAANEQWIAMRSSHFEREAKQTDTLAVLVEAAKYDRRVINGVADVSIALLAQLALTLNTIPSDRAASTRGEICQTVSFALKNLTASVREVGIVGVSKTLPGLGKEENGRWNPEMLQQINVTVQNLQAQAESGKVAPTAAPAPKPAEVAEWEG